MINLEHVTKQYDSIVAVNDFSYQFKDGIRTAILGPSGCGKSTLLKLISHLEKESSGTLASDYKNVSIVFQDYCLFEHLTAFENIAYGIDQRTISKEQLEMKVKDIAHLVGADLFLDQRVNTLSGGQKQRVSIGRALMKEPDLLLMDEPFCNLNLELKKELMDNIIEIQEKKKFTLIYVTHDQFEADYLGQDTVYMK